MPERFALVELAAPIVQAPLAGGPSTTALAIAVCEAGGLGFLAAGYKQPAAVRAEIEAVRAATARPFGVNLFVPSREPADLGVVREYLEELAPEVARQGVELGEPRHDDDQWEQKLELVCRERVRVVSFTFGCPDCEVIDRLHRVGSAAWVTVTNPREALQAQDAGADALIVQGIEAGGHRGGFLDDERSEAFGLLALLRLVAHLLPLPMIAAGGIADGDAVAAVLCAGASAAQIGTALMLAPEAGTAEVHRLLLRQPTATSLTRAFTGRLARGLVNRFLTEHTRSAPVAYPEIHHATSPLRAAARKRGDADSINLWAGQAHQLANALPAAEIVTRLSSDARTAIARASERTDHRAHQPQRQTSE
jgi:nitronate monooxygenase